MSITKHTLLRAQLISAILMGVFSTAANAQVRTDTALTALLRSSALHRWYLRVDTDSGTFEGRIHDMRPGHASLDRTPIDYATVRTIQRRILSRSTAGRDALTGGAIVGLLLGAGYSSLCEVPGCRMRTVEVAIFGGSAAAGLVWLISDAAHPRSATWVAEWPK